jgi:hypothetical protein
LHSALAPLVTIYGERQAFASGRGQSCGELNPMPSPLAGERSRQRRVGEGERHKKSQSSRISECEAAPLDQTALFVLVLIVGCCLFAGALPLDHDDGEN